MKTINVLLIEDNAGDARLIKELLKEVTQFHCALTIAVKLQRGLELMSKSPFDIILLDLSLPDSSGEETFLSVQQRCNNVPIVLISGLEDVQFSIKLINEGAQDYVNKTSLTSPLLEKTIQHSIERNKLRRSLENEIDDRIIAISQIQRSEIQYRELFESNPNPMWVYDLATLRFLAVNDRAIAKYGYSREEFLNMTIKDIRPEEDLEQLAKNLQSANIGLEEAGKWRHRKKDGEIIYVEIVSHTTEYEGKQAKLVMANDITNRFQIETKLRESEAKLQIILESTADGILAVDSNGKIIKMNKRFAELWQISSEILASEDDEVLLNFVLDQLINPEQFLNKVHLLYQSLDQDLDVLKFKDGRIFERFSTPLLVDTNIIGRVWSFRDITERKRTEEKLRESEVRYRTIVDNVRQAYYEVNGRSLFTYCNPGLLIISGYVEKELLGTSPFRLIAKEHRSRIIEQYRQWESEKRKDMSIEFLVQKKNGEKFWVEQITHCHYDKHGKLMSATNFLRDIDERKKKDMQIEMLAQALRSIDECVSITDMNDNIFFVNKAFCTTYGYNENEVIGKHVSMLRSSHNNPVVISNILNQTQKGGWHGELSNRKKNGEEFIIELTTSVIRNDQGEGIAMIGVAKDITERNKASQQIEEQAMLIDEAHEAIIVADITFLIVYWNKGAERLFGWKAEEAIGKNITTLVYQDMTDFRKDSEQLFNKGNYSSELNLLNKKKQNITVAIRLSLIKDKEGNPKSVLAMASDITDKKKHEDQFLRTQRMGSLGTLAGGIAHDLNNVLAPIMLSVELLKRTYVDTTSQKILESVESSTRRGSEIVKQILAFARGVETQKILLQPRHVIKEVVGIFKETFPRSIAITSDIPGTIWTIIGDPTHFHQLIMNLGVNARDAMPDGGTLSITASNEVIDEQYVRMNIEATAGRYVMFSIKDTGVGMTPHVLDHLFEPFFTTKEVGKGTGLGLSTVYTIVKSHNGFIKVYSEVGKGTAFNVYLPASESTIIELDEKAAPQDFFGHGELILVVDDEKSIREVTKQTLEAYNYTVITASDGSDGVAQFVGQMDAVALVITDMMMPVMDGHHLIMALRKINPGIKIIASSGLIDKPKIMGTGENTVSSFIEKPYTAEKLMSVVSSVIKEK